MSEMRTFVSLLVSACLVAAVVSIPAHPDAESGKKARSGIKRVTFLPYRQQSLAARLWWLLTCDAVSADADSYFAKQDVITDVHELEHFVADHSDQVGRERKKECFPTLRDLIRVSADGTGCASLRV